MSHPILTVGHSTRPIEEFIGLLQQHGVRMLVDVRGHTPLPLQSPVQSR